MWIGFGSIGRREWRDERPVGFEGCMGMEGFPRGRRAVPVFRLWEAETSWPWNFALEDEGLTGAQKKPKETNVQGSTARGWDCTEVRSTGSLQVSLLMHQMLHKYSHFTITAT